MQIVQVLAGYSLGSADLLRRAMSKKKPDVMAKHRQIFLYGDEKMHIDGALKRGVDEQVANAIFDEMENFAKYAFNKSHAAAYAVLAYETAYFKRYYNIEFIAAVINNRITNADEVQKYLTYLRNKGYKIYPPDVNKSRAVFKTENGGLRFGLGGIKNVGETAMQTLVEEREKNGEYKSISDMLSRLPAGTINKRIFENLIKAGAFDGFGYTRASLMACYEGMLNLSAYEKKKQGSGQLSLFDFMEEEKTDDVPSLPEFPPKVLLDNEKDALNVYLSGHPLDEWKEVLEKQPFSLKPLAEYLDEIANIRAGEKTEDEGAGDDFGDNGFLELIRTYNDKTVSVCGMLSHVTPKVTKSGKLMGYGVLEDFHATIEVVFFPNVFSKVHYVIPDDAIVRVTGRLNLEEERASIVAMDVKLLENTAVDEEEEEKEEEKQTDVLYVKVVSNEQYEDVLGLLRYAPGNVETFVQFNGKLYKCKEKADISGALVSQLRDLLGDACVKTAKKK